jgi:N-methylhydantoinase B/oxoprolinase/acetone carboxylase alpha subunit
MDPIAFELFKNAIFSIADEMALTVFRTTYSGVLKDNMDYSTGFPQVKGAINNTLSFTKAASYTGVRSVLPQGIPNNEGVFRA